MAPPSAGSRPTPSFDMRKTRYLSKPSAEAICRLDTIRLRSCRRRSPMSPLSSWPPDTSGIGRKFTAAIPTPGWPIRPTPFRTASQTIARGIFVPPGEVNATYYDVNQIMHTIWTGAKYDVRTNLSVASQLYLSASERLPARARDLHRLRRQYQQSEMRGQPVRHFLPDRLQAVRSRRPLRRRNDLECLRRPRERLLQDPKHRPDRRPAHPISEAATARPQLTRLLSRQPLLQSSGSRLKPSLSFVTSGRAIDR